MKILLFFCTMLILLTPGIAQINTPSGATIPFNGNGNYQYGIMPSNLPSGGTYGKSQAAADAYNSWKQDFVEDCSVGKRVKYDDRSLTVSEGIGYGMLLAAYAADKTLFDGLWQYYKNNSNGNGLMNWKISGCSGTAGSGGATDADLDAAMALIVATCQWPSATNPYNYKNEATALITAIKDHEIHYSSYQAINGDGWGFGNNCRNPSYQSPAYYKAFGDFVPSQASFWNNAVNASYTLINANANGTTGLVSNWSDPSGQPNGCNGPNEYGYDACRNPWRMGVDVIWHNDSKAAALCNKMAAYIQGKGAGSVGGSIPQSGGNGTHNSTFVSTFSAAICGAGSSYQTLMNAMYTENVSTKDNTYFGMTLRTIMLFMETGNFWKPCSSVTDVSVSLSTSPASNTVFTEGDAITLNATASTSNGTITKVDFYDGSTLLGTDNSSPYSFSISSLSSGSHDLKAVATSSSGQTGTATVSISANKAVFKTSAAPSIDGVVDVSWANFDPAAITKVIQGSVSALDLSAQWRANWDNSNLYVLVEVTDDAKENDSNTEIYNDDAIEVYIDINNDKATSYGANDFQYTLRWDDATVYEKNNKTTGVILAQTTTSTGYIIEVKIPWATLSGSPSTGQLVGFDVHVNDDDDGGVRDDKISWAATSDDAWENPSLLGTVVLKAAPCTLPTAATSISGGNTACAGSSATYTTNTVSGATSYTWAAPSGSTITSGQGSTSISVQWGSASGNVTVTPTNACGSGTASSLSVTIGGASVPAVTISGPSSICVGASATFSATPSNGGSSPSFQWKINGSAIGGETSSTYTSTTGFLLDNDKVTVVLTSNATCVSSPTVTSDPLTISIDQRPTQANAGLDQNISSSSATFEGNEPLVGVGTWTKVNGAGTITNKNNYNGMVSGLQTGVNTFAWTIANGACPSSSDNVIINVGEDIPVISKTSAAPTIDGLADASWDGYIPTAITKVIQGSVGSSSDLSAQWRAVWDNSNLYILIEVTDNTQEYDSNTETYNDDAVEVYIDINNDKASSYGTNDFQYIFRWNDADIYETNGKSTDNVVLEQTTTSTGYIIEAKIPWATLSGSPVTGQSIGFDVHVNDDDDGGVRDAKISWAASTDDAWQNPSLFGTAILEGESAITSTYSKVVSAYKAAPNPFKEKTYITVNKVLKGDITARVTDARGIVVQEITGIQSGEQIELGSNLGSGVYLVQLISTEGIEILRVIKSK